MVKQRTNRAKAMRPRELVETAPQFVAALPVLERVATLANRSDVPPIVLERMLAPLPNLHRRTLEALERLAQRSNLARPRGFEGAIATLGVHSVRDACLIVALHGFHEAAAEGVLSPRALTSQAVAVASASGALCASPRVCTSGLIANVGIAAMAAGFGEPYRAMVASLAGSSQELHRAERALFQFDHGEMGGTILRDAGAREPLVDVCRRHLEFEGGAPEGEWQRVALAECLVHQLGFDGGAANMPRELGAKECEALGLTESRMARIADRVTRWIDLTLMMVS
jgi:hypothetical protein